MSLNVLRLDAIISRQVEAVIVIYINHILEAVHHHIAILHIVVNRQVVLLLEVQAAQVVAIVINQRQQLIHHMAAVLRRAVHQRRIVMIPMMTDMMIYIWMVTMTTTDMIETVIMQMAWMMQWMNLEKIGRLEVALWMRCILQ